MHFPIIKYAISLATLYQIARLGSEVMTYKLDNRYVFMWLLVTLGADMNNRVQARFMGCPFVESLSLKSCGP